MPTHPRLAEVKSVALCVEGEATAGREAAWLGGAAPPGQLAPRRTAPLHHRHPIL